ncbi:MAG: iron-containing alcohol dehydrogenase [Pseudomonadales bacterium]
MFSLQILFYKFMILGIRLLSRFLPQSKPLLLTGPGSSLQLCATLANFGSKKVLIVTDAMLRKLGILDPITTELDKHRIQWVIYDGVEPDPSLLQVEQGLALLKNQHCDSVLAVGGGSSMDAAKVIAAGATNDKSVKDFVGMLKVRNVPLPFFAIPTTAGTGSEVTLAAVISDPDTHEKLKIIDAKLIPLAAALDPVLMTGLPPHITAATGMDALTHAIEAYISNLATPETDRYALAATKMILESLPRAYAYGDDMQARDSMALASCYAGLAFTKANVGYVHAFAHNFGASYGTPHGLANAIALPHILEFSKDAAAERLAELARAGGLGDDSETDSVLAQRFVDRVFALNQELNIPLALDALQESDISRLAKAALHEAHYLYAVPKYMTLPECETIMRRLLV